MPHLSVVGERASQCAKYLDIPMYNVQLLVNVLDGIEQLQRHLAEDRLGNALGADLLDNVLERATVHVLEHDAYLALLIEGAEELDDAWVRASMQRAQLLQHLLAQVLSHVQRNHLREIASDCQPIEPCRHRALGIVSARPRRLTHLDRYGSAGRNVDQALDDARGARSENDASVLQLRERRDDDGALFASLGDGWRAAARGAGGGAWWQRLARVASSFMLALDR